MLPGRCFRDKGGESCSDVAIDKRGGRLIASVELVDRRTCLAILSLDAVFDHLRLRQLGGDHSVD